MHQRQRAEAADPLIGRRRHRRVWRTLAQLQVVHRLLDGIGARRCDNHAEAPDERQQVTHGYRPAGRNGVVERAIRVPHDHPVGQFGQQSVHRILEPQLALLHADHRCGGRDRLGHRGDTEDRVIVDGRASQVGRADRLDQRVASPAHRQHEPGYLAALDVARHDVAHAGQPRFRQSAAAHVLFPPLT